MDWPIEMKPFNFYLITNIHTDSKMSHSDSSTNTCNQEEAGEE